MIRDEAIRILTHDADTGEYTGNLSVPCSRWGRTGEECAGVAHDLDSVICEVSGGEPTAETLDYAMSLVVNDHDDVAYVLREHGGADIRERYADELSEESEARLTTYHECSTCLDVVALGEQCECAREQVDDSGEGEHTRGMTDSTTTTTTTTDAVYAWTTDGDIYTGPLRRWASHVAQASYDGTRVSNPYALDTAADAGIRTRRVTLVTDATDGDDYRFVTYRDPVNGASAVARYDLRA